VCTSAFAFTFAFAIATKSVSQSFNLVLATIDQTYDEMKNKEVTLKYFSFLDSKVLLD
jgi:hypothetical protein